MQCVILCGGLGTRLREETEFRPKPMVRIGERPIIWHIMKHYSRYGVDRFVLALGYKGEMIRDFFLRYSLINCDVTIELGKPDQFKAHGHHDESDWTVTLADTGQDNLKGSRLKQVERYIDGNTFMMTYGDGVSNVDIDALLKFHRSHGKLATVTGVSATSRFGELKIDGDCVTSFLEKPNETNDFINGGFFVFNRKVFDFLNADASCDLEYGPMEAIVKDGQLMVYRHTGFWACMDTLRDVDYLNGLWNRGEAAWKTW